MAVGALGLVCASLLLFGGVWPQTDTIQRFSRPGDDITLPCKRLENLGPSCSHVNWQYDKFTPFAVLKVSNGQVVDRKASRITLDSESSLHLHNVAVNDSGRFTCRLRDSSEEVTFVFLNVLTVSRAAADSRSSITLECKLEKLDSSCGTFRWLDQTKMLLSGEKTRQTNCVSYLTVEPESPVSRTFTCEYEEDREVKVSEEFRLEGKGSTHPTQAPGGDHNSQMYVIIGAVASLLVLLIVAAVVLFKIKSKRSAPQTKDTPDFPMAHPPTDPVVDLDSGVTYAMIDHKKPKPKKQVVVEDSVTYSAVSVRTAADTDNSAIYSTVCKTK